MNSSKSTCGGRSKLVKPPRVKPPQHKSSAGAGSAGPHLAVLVRVVLFQDARDLASGAAALSGPRCPALRAQVQAAGGVGGHREDQECLPPTPRTNRTRRVPHPVLIGHAASLIPYREDQEETLLVLPAVVESQRVSSSSLLYALDPNGSFVWAHLRARGRDAEAAHREEDLRLVKLQTRERKRRQRCTLERQIRQTERERMHATLTVTNGAAARLGSADSVQGTRLPALVLVHEVKHLLDAVGRQRGELLLREAGAERLLDHVPDFFGRKEDLRTGKKGRRAEWRRRDPGRGSVAGCSRRVAQARTPRFRGGGGCGTHDTPTTMAGTSAGEEHSTRENGSVKEKSLEWWVVEGRGLDALDEASRRSGECGASAAGGGAGLT